MVNNRPEQSNITNENPTRYHDLKPILSPSLSPNPSQLRACKIRHAKADRALQNPKRTRRYY